MNAIVRQAGHRTLGVLVLSAALAAADWTLYLAYVIDADRFTAGLWFVAAVLGGGVAGVVLHALSSLYLLAVALPDDGEDGGAPGCPAADVPLAHPGALHPFEAASLRADSGPRGGVAPPAPAGDTAVAGGASNFRR